MPEAPARTVFVEYGDQQIPVSVAFAERKRLSISVRPDGSVTALAPAGRSLGDVLRHLHRRRSWIARQRRRFETYQPAPDSKRFISGETHLYLGRQYRLRVWHAREVNVKLVGRFFNAHVPSPKEPIVVRTALDAWYRVHAEQIFRERIARCLESAPSLRGIRLCLRIRRMHARWGSCSKAGTITLSTELVKVPLHCIEYVIMHELCHLRIHDHSPKFFRLLSRCMPDWQTRKALLDSIVLR